MRIRRTQHSDREDRATRPSFGFAIVVIFSLLQLLGCGPIGPFSGGRLSGEDGSWPVDWKSAADISQIQLETAPDDPHSVNVWVVVVDDEAFIATSLLMGTEVPEERGWVRNISTDPRIRVRVDGVVYPARLDVLDDSAEISDVFAAFRVKYPELKEARGEGARFYRIARRKETPMP